MDSSSAALPDIADIIRSEMARRRLSRAELAHQAGISLSTLEKALSGARPFTLATLVRLEDMLGVPLRRSAHPPASHAPVELGAYTRDAVRTLEGDYLTLRPSFERPEAIYAYRMRIAWDDAVPGLIFSEAARTDAAFSQKGKVAAPHQSGHIYLITNSDGQHRLAILGRPTIDGDLYGLLSTLQAGDGSHLTPVAVPLALIPLKAGEAPLLGQIGPGETGFEGYRQRLGTVLTKGYAKLAGL